MSEYWGYRCRTCCVSSDHELNRGEDTLQRLWRLRDCVAAVHGAIGGTLEVQLLGDNAGLPGWMAQHRRHVVVLENDYGDWMNIGTGGDARKTIPDGCACAPDVVVVTLTQPAGQHHRVLSRRIRDALKDEAKRRGVETDRDEWHWWRTDSDSSVIVGHMPVIRPYVHDHGHDMAAEQPNTQSASPDQPPAPEEAR